MDVKMLLSIMTHIITTLTLMSPLLHADIHVVILRVITLNVIMLDVVVMNVINHYKI